MPFLYFPSSFINPCFLLLHFPLPPLAIYSSYTHCFHQPHLIRYRYCYTCDVGVGEWFGYSLRVHISTWMSYPPPPFHWTLTFTSLRPLCLHRLLETLLLSSFIWSFLILLYSFSVSPFFLPLRINFSLDIDRCSPSWVYIFTIYFPIWSDSWTAVLISRCLAVFLVSPVVIVYKYMQEGKVMLAKLLKKATVPDQVHRGWK